MLQVSLCRGLNFGGKASHQCHSCYDSSDSIVFQWHDHCRRPRRWEPVWRRMAAQTAGDAGHGVAQRRFQGATRWTEGEGAEAAHQQPEESNQSCEWVSNEENTTLHVRERAVFDNREVSVQPARPVWRSVSQATQVATNSMVLSITLPFVFHSLGNSQ